MPNDRDPSSDLTTLRVRRPDDLHVHLRSGDLLRDVIEHTARNFARALVMPNTVPPVLDADDAEKYAREIAAANHWDFQPLLTIRLVPQTAPDTVRRARAAGVVAAKLYPDGVTTNSAGGVRDFDDLADVFDTMATEGMILCIHGESPDSFSLDRESDFVTGVLPGLVERHPDLRIVLEHVSSEVAVDWVLAQPFDGTPRVGATITVHHLVLTLDDVIGGMNTPHHFCKPIAKRPADRRALIAAATSGDPRFFLGTDSAPHPRSGKETAHGAAGVFTAPVALPVLAEVFEDAGALDRLEAFCSVHGANFYGIPLNEGTALLVREPWTVPESYGDVVPFRAGTPLRWRLSPT